MRLVPLTVLLLTTTSAAAQDRVARVEVDKQAASQIRAVLERTTKGAPFSAEAVTEFVQTLADGNRIARRTVVRIYRDGEGRVRRETLKPDGSIQTVTIADPVANTHVVLDPERRAAHQAGFRELRGVAPGGGEQWRALETESRRRVAVPPPPPPDAPPPVTPAIVPPEPPTAPPPGSRMRVPSTASGDRGQAESLGLRTLEGLSARGTRTTTVIPAGTIGNDQPIRIVSEEWFSDDLKVLVQTRHSDPRSGETTYTLSNVVRAEPDRSLFEVPADYSLNMPTKRELPSRD